MTWTSTTRDSRVAGAAGALALAYFRLMAEGDFTRASIVLGEFQAYWTHYGNEAVDPGNQTVVSVDGMYGTPTAQAAYYSLQAIGAVPSGLASSFPTSAGGVAAFYRSSVRSSGVPVVLWGAWEAATSAAFDNVGGAVGSWALAFGPNYAPSTRTPTPDSLEAQSRTESTGPSDVHVEDEVVITAIPLRRQTSFWPVAIAGGALLVTGIGLAWGLKRRR